MLFSFPRQPSKVGRKKATSCSVKEKSEEKRAMKPLWKQSTLLLSLQYGDQSQFSREDFHEGNDGDTHSSQAIRPDDRAAHGENK